MLIHISTPEKEVYRNEACSIVASTSDGQLKIFPKHAPLLAILRPGILHIDCMSDCHCPEIIADAMFIAGGFIEVQPDIVTILANRIERCKDIDAHMAEQAVQLAREQLRVAPPKHASEAQLEMEIAVARLSIASTRDFSHPVL